jgi:hypothetical protein
MADGSVMDEFIVQNGGFMKRIGIGGVLVSIIACSASAPPSSTTTNAITIEPSSDVAQCSSTPTTVTSGVTTFAASSGTVAYMLHDGTMSVLPATSKTPLHLVPPPTFRAIATLAVDDQFVFYTQSPTDGVQPMSGVSVDYLHGTWKTVVSDKLVEGTVLASHQAYVLASDSSAGPLALEGVAVDGSSQPLVVAPQPATFLRDGAGVAWLDDHSMLWTLIDGVTTKHDTKVDLAPLAIDGSTLYARGRNGDAIVSMPIDGDRRTTTLAQLLPANYPTQGAESPSGVDGFAVGTKRIFWVECWANADIAANWVVRAQPIGGGAVETVDSFTSSSQSATHGTCPQLAADGVAVYWSHEGDLMRMCE